MLTDQIMDEQRSNSTSDSASDLSNASATGGSPTYAEVMEMIRAAVSNIRVYVLESDISAAQQAVKTVVEQSTF